MWKQKAPRYAEGLYCAERAHLKYHGRKNREVDIMWIALCVGIKDTERDSSVCFRDDCVRYATPLPHH